MDNQDKRFLNLCVSEIKNSKIFNSYNCEFPLDNEVIEILSSLNEKLESSGDDYEIFRYKKNIDNLWGTLLEKSIKCLRYYDSREPFLNSEFNKKSPKAYGINDLKSYYEKYSEFEKVLYGTSRYYRDHIIHVFRTWLIGIWLLTNNKGEYLNQISIPEKGFTVKLNNAEKVSIWTIIALTHDLGYPLEKAKDVIDITQKMISTFISNPDISSDLSFHGVQNYMNDFIVRLMSSKMKIKKTIDLSGEKSEENEKDKKIEFVARLQPKYYFKFQKSLEKNSHGILSTIIIYKLLTYFLESDYNINEDYTFEEEDCRQFYIRREILRSIASHTCDDVYQLYIGSFALLLRICDDTQEWGRKNISELYVKTNQTYELKDIIIDIDSEEKTKTCTIKEEIEISSAYATESVFNLIKRYREQSLVYITIFRDGQDTAKRDFSFIKNLLIKFNQVEIKLVLSIPNGASSSLKGEINYTSISETNKEFAPEKFECLPLQSKVELRGENSKFVNEQDAGKWRKGSFELSLID